MSLTSAEMTTSLLYVNQNGVSPMGVLVVVLYAHSMLGNYSSHMPFASSSRVLIILSKDRWVGEE